MYIYIYILSESVLYLVNLKLRGGGKPTKHIGPSVDKPTTRFAGDAGTATNMYIYINITYIYIYVYVLKTKKEMKPRVARLGIEN